MIFASQGPILSTDSIAAAMMAVLTLSRLEGMMMAPLVLSLALSRLISIRPIRPDFCRSLRSRSGPNRPSVWPKTAPTTSGFSTTPWTSNFAFTMYLVVDAYCEDSTVIV